MRRLVPKSASRKVFRLRRARQHVDEDRAALAPELFRLLGRGDARAFKCRRHRRGVLFHAIGRGLLDRPGAGGRADEHRGEDDRAEQRYS